MLDKQQNVINYQYNLINYILFLPRPLSFNIIINFLSLFDGEKRNNIKIVYQSFFFVVRERKLIRKKQMKFRNEAERKKKSISYHDEQATIHTE